MISLCRVLIFRFVQFCGNYPPVHLHSPWPLYRCKNGWRRATSYLVHGGLIPSINLNHMTPTNTYIPQYIVAWPVAKLLELVLGPHHGIIYRRAGELQTRHLQSSLGLNA